MCKPRHRQVRGAAAALLPALVLLLLPPRPTHFVMSLLQRGTRGEKAY